MHLQHLLREYLELYGYAVLFAGTFLEGEAVLIMAGFLAFQGYLDLAGVMLTAWAGSFLGDQFYFHLGRYQGRALLRRFHGIARKFRQALRLMERYGVLVAFVSRYTYGFRIVLPLILGLTSLPPRTFLWINLISALSWSAVFSLAGYLFGKSASLFLEDVSRYEHLLIPALMGFVATAWLIHVHHAWKRRKPVRDRLTRMRALRAARSPRQ